MLWKFFENSPLALTVVILTGNRREQYMSICHLLCFTHKHIDSSSSSLPFNSCRSTGHRRYSATPPDLVPCSPLRSSSVLCSQLLNCPLPCVLWSSSVSTTLRGPSQSFFHYTAASFPHCIPNPCPLPTSNCCLHGILLSYVPQFLIGYLVFPVDVEDSSWTVVDVDLNFVL